MKIMNSLLVIVITFITVIALISYKPNMLVISNKVISNDISLFNGRSMAHPMIKPQSGIGYLFDNYFNVNIKASRELK